MALLSGCSASKDDDAVLIPIQAMFNGMAHRDAAAIKAPWLPGGVLVVVNDCVLSQFTVEFWANRVATSGTTHIEELIHDPEIHIDHDLAVVLAPPLKFYRWQARSLRQGSLQSQPEKWQMADRRARCHNPERLRCELASALKSCCTTNLSSACHPPIEFRAVRSQCGMT